MDDNETTMPTLLRADRIDGSAPIAPHLQSADAKPAALVTDMRTPTPPGPSIAPVQTRIRAALGSFGSMVLVILLPAAIG
ncbi:MAG: hypothetical protein K2Y56_17660 [Methylobacterium sp.]|uniref:hypothetical protein n=1 Tax=Methylobacterium sp. TaxID=409 RepID=UPI0025F893C3|nr:hypothetical protein [Methylobacterium sp.]MBX9933334.1 hypothetical protein [Methylobacterium sp.]